MSNQDLSHHDAMEIHELLNLKTICVTKSKLLQGLVFDQDLKALMNKDVQQSILSISDLRNLYPTVDKKEVAAHDQ